MSAIRWILVVAAAVLVLFATGVAQAADSPAPDDGGGDSTSEPSEQPSSSADPTDEPTSQPTQKPTSSAPAQSGNDQKRTSGGGSTESHSDASNSGSSGAKSDVPSSGPSAFPTEGDEPRTDDATPTSAPTDWASFLGWGLLAGGLASAAGAVVIYRRHPGLISLPWLRTAH